MSSQPSTTIGVDIGDRHSHLCLLDTKTGDVVEESRIATNPAAFERRFAGSAPVRIAIEAGTHSPWISRLLEEHGHEVLVANPRKLRLIYGEGRKTDRLDAENLARLAPLRHRGEISQAHLALIRSRDALIRSEVLGLELPQEGRRTPTGSTRPRPGVRPGDDRLPHRPDPRLRSRD